MPFSWIIIYLIPALLLVSLIMPSVRLPHPPRSPFSFVSFNPPASIFLPSHIQSHHRIIFWDGKNSFQSSARHLLLCCIFSAGDKRTCLSTLLHIRKLIQKLLLIMWESSWGEARSSSVFPSFRHFLLIIFFLFPPSVEDHRHHRALFHARYSCIQRKRDD